MPRGFFRELPGRLKQNSPTLTHDNISQNKVNTKIYLYRVKYQCSSDFVAALSVSLPTYRLQREGGKYHIPYLYIAGFATYVIRNFWAMLPMAPSNQGRCCMGNVAAIRWLTSMTRDMWLGKVILRYCDQPASRLGIWLVRDTVFCSDKLNGSLLIK